MGFLTSRITVAIMAALIAGLATWAGFQYVKLQKARADVSEMRSERDEAAAARDKALAVNTANQETIDKLQQEKQDIQESLNKLEEDRKRNQQVISNLSAAIRATANNPENQVKLSPVLKATVDSIQKQRAARSGGAQ